MKLLRGAGLTLIGVCLLTACGTGETPESAAEEWLEALANMDGNELLERTCAEQQGNVQEAGLWLSAFAVLAQSFTGQQTEADISDLNFAVVDKSGDTARVRVSGQIRTAVLAVAQVQEVDEVWRMVREDGKWKWCGN